MSRTFRRVRQRRGKHNQEFPHRSQNFLKLYFRDKKCVMSTPSHWVHDMMTVPQRAETRRLLQVLHRLHDLEDSPEFPLSKKPHMYYW